MINLNLKFAFSDNFFADLFCGYYRLMYICAVKLKLNDNSTKL